jgi:hypothetical protein
VGKILPASQGWLKRWRGRWPDPETAERMRAWAMSQGVTIGQLTRDTMAEAERLAREERDRRRR